MNRYEDDPDAALDGIVSDIREDEASDEVVSGAARRVWARLSGESSHEAGQVASIAASDGRATGASASDPAAIAAGCAAYQAQIPALLTRTLPAARALLLEDHVRDCASCRAALETARGGRVSANCWQN